METATMRKELHQYIDESDDKLVKMVYALVREYNEETDGITEERRRLIMAERERHLKGESQSKSWEEVKQMILSKKSI